VSREEPESRVTSGDSGAVRAAVYVRALFADRAPRRRHDLEEYVASRGWELVAVYQDVGNDARLGSQPSLVAALANLDTIDKLVVTRLDSLGRSVPQLLETVRRLLASNVDLICMREGLDTGAAEGHVALAVLETLEGWQLVSTCRQDSGWKKLASYSFSPATVIDVGAADGTRALYAAFPSAHHVLIEPLSEHEQALSEIATQYRAEYLPTAVGSSQGVAEIYVDLSLLRSSLLKKVRPRPEQARQIPVTTLDALLEERGWAPPFGLKIDAEGFEHHVIEGATTLLEKTQFVVAEVSVSERFLESCTSGQLIELLRSRGFAVRDILFAGGGGLFADILFSRIREE
jgi:FkbM family methyltransferase